MNNCLFEHIADIIQRHRTWIRVVEINRWIDFNLIVDGHIKNCPCRVLTLENFRVRYGFCNQRKWNIPEYDIAAAVVALIKKDSSARNRTLDCNLSLWDVEYIIEKASFGILKLELDKYDL